MKVLIIFPLLKIQKGRNLKVAKTQSIQSSLWLVDDIFLCFGLRWRKCWKKGAKRGIGLQSEQHMDTNGPHRCPWSNCIVNINGNPWILRNAHHSPTLWYFIGHNVLYESVKIYWRAKQPANRRRRLDPILSGNAPIEMFFPIADFKRRILLPRWVPNHAINPLLK